MKKQSAKDGSSARLHGVDAIVETPAPGRATAEEGSDWVELAKVFA